MDSKVTCVLITLLVIGALIYMCKGKTMMGSYNTNSSNYCPIGVCQWNGYCSDKVTPCVYKDYPNNCVNTPGLPTPCPTFDGECRNFGGGCFWDGTACPSCV